MENHNLLKGSLHASIFCMGLFSTFYIMKLFSFQLSTLFAALTLVLIVLLRGTICIWKVNRTFLYFLFIVSISSVLNLVFPLHETYSIKVSLRAILEYVVLYFCAEQMFQLKKTEIRYFLNGLRWSCIIHMLWAVLQFIAYRGFRIDINDLILSNMLHLGNDEYGASRYEGGELVLSGLCWHPINLAPTLAIAVLLFDKWYVWMVAFFIAFYSKNGTTMLVLILLLILQISLVKSKRKKIRTRWVTSSKRFMMLPAVLIVFLFIGIHLFPLIQEALVDIVSRISKTNDSSTQAHLRYYTAFPSIASSISPLELLFGCGIGRSGAYISQFFHQYTKIAYWSVESDPMNILYSTGLFGFVGYYLWLIIIVIRSWKIDKRITAFLIAIMIGGIFYGIQFAWVMQIELIIGVLIKRRESIFRMESKQQASNIFVNHDLL